MRSGVRDQQQQQLLEDGEQLQEFWSLVVPTSSRGQH